MMSTGRNDPCPCGSGRKYKQCCQARDAEEARRADEKGRPFRGRLTRAQRDEAAAAETWAADAIPLMVHFEADDAPRPVLVLVTAGDLLVHQDFAGRLGGGAEAVAAAIERVVVAAGREVGTLPERLVVRHDDVAAALEPMADARDMAVEAADAPELVAVARHLMQNVAGYDVWPPACRTDSWDAWDLPRALVADVFTAAAGFYRQAPWRHASNLQAPRALLPSGRTWTCGILGNGGEAFGLTLYSVAADLFDVVALHRPGELFRDISGRMLTLSFDTAPSAGADVVRMVRTRRLELAGPAAYPILTTINTPGGGVSRDEITDLIALLRALPPFIDAHRGRLEREERTRDPLDLFEWTEPDSGIVFRYAGEAARVRSGEMTLELPFGIDDELREAFEQVMNDPGAGADTDAMMDALNRAIAQKTDAYNERPQGELRGLAPAQVRRLVASDWQAPNDVVRLRRDLDADDVADSDILRRARALLDFTVQRGPLDATQAGNLKLAVVSALVDHLGLTEEYARLREHTKRITEQDVWPLHIARVLCELGGLLAQRKQRFHITSEGRRLADREHAGELYALLFHTWFRVLDLEYVAPLEWPELQQQVAFTLYRLPDAAADWKNVDELLPAVVLPFALDRAPRGGLPHLPLAPMVLGSCVLRPLVSFGLLESRPSARDASGWDVEYRVTPLAAKFMRFELD